MVRSGFSLIETMVVITIIGILAVTVHVNTSFFTASLMRAQLTSLCNMCQLARHTAMASNSTETITFDLRAHTYRWKDRVEQLPIGMKFGYIPGTKGPPSNPVAPLYTPVTFTGSHITFYPDGIIQAGTVYLVDTNATTMYALSNAVAHISYLRLYRYDGAWKLL